VVNGDFVEQLWVEVIVGGKSLFVCTALKKMYEAL
jgi:hypothetical protein